MYASMSTLVYFLKIEAFNLYSVFNVMTTSPDHSFCLKFSSGFGAGRSKIVYQMLL